MLTYVFNSWHLNNFSFHLHHNSYFHGKNLPFSKLCMVLHRYPSICYPSWHELPSGLRYLIWTQVVTGFLPLSSVRFGKAGWQLMGRIRLKIKSNHLSNHSVDGVADSNALICFDLTWSIWRKMFQYIFTQPFSVLKVLMRTKGCVIFYVKLIRDRRMRKKYRDRGFTSFANNASGVFFKKYDERSIYNQTDISQKHQILIGSTCLYIMR